MRNIFIPASQQLLTLLLISGALCISGLCSDSTCFPDGVIVDRTAVVGAGRGLQALNLESGKSIWTLSRDGIPLAAYYQSALVAAFTAGGFRILLVDAASGAIREESEAIKFSSSTVVTASRFDEIVAAVHGTTATIRWRLSGHPTGAGYRSDSVVETSENLAEVDLQTGRVGPSRTVPTQEAPPSVPYLRFGRWSNVAWSLPAGRSSVLSASNDQLALESTRKNGDKSRTTLSISGGEPPIVTDDGEEVLLAPRSQPRTFAIFSVLTGHRVGTFELNATINRACLHDHMLYLKAVSGSPDVTPMLIALDTRTMKIRWQHTLTAPESGSKSHMLPQ